MGQFRKGETVKTVVNISFTPPSAWCRRVIDFKLQIWVAPSRTKSSSGGILACLISASTINDHSDGIRGLLLNKKHSNFRRNRSSQDHQASVEKVQNKLESLRGIETQGRIPIWPERFPSFSSRSENKILRVVEDLFRLRRQKLPDVLWGYGWRQNLQLRWIKRRQVAGDTIIVGLNSLEGCQSILRRKVIRWWTMQSQRLLNPLTHSTLSSIQREMWAQNWFKLWIRTVHTKLVQRLTDPRCSVWKRESILHRRSLHGLTRQGKDISMSSIGKRHSAHKISSQQTVQKSKPADQKITAQVAAEPSAPPPCCLPLPPRLRFHFPCPSPGFPSPLPDLLENSSLKRRLCFWMLAFSLSFSVIQEDIEATYAWPADEMGASDTTSKPVKSGAEGDLATAISRVNKRLVKCSKDARFETSIWSLVSAKRSASHKEWCSWTMAPLPDTPDDRSQERWYVGRSPGPSRMAAKYSRTALGPVKGQSSNLVSLSRLMASLKARWRFPAPSRWSPRVLRSPRLSFFWFVKLVISSMVISLTYSTSPSQLTTPDWPMPTISSTISAGTGLPNWDDDGSAENHWRAATSAITPSSKMAHCGRQRGTLIEIRHSPHSPYLPWASKLIEIRHSPHSPDLPW